MKSLKRLPTLRDLAAAAKVSNGLGHGPSLADPVVELRATCAELGVNFALPVPLKGPEARSLHGLAATMATALLSQRALDLGKAAGADRFNQLLIDRAAILAERHTFYMEVQARYEVMAQHLDGIKRDYYREIDNLREQISRLSRNPAHDVPDVVFFHPDSYKIPPWEEIVEMLDDRRMRRELQMEEGAHVVNKVPVEVLCPSCRCHFTKGTRPEQRPCESSAQTESADFSSCEAQTDAWAAEPVEDAERSELKAQICQLQSELAMLQLRNQQLHVEQCAKAARPAQPSTPATSAGSSRAASPLPAAVDGAGKPPSRAHIRRPSDAVDLDAEHLEQRAVERRLARKAFTALKMLRKRGRVKKLQDYLSRRARELAAYSAYIQRMAFARWRKYAIEEAPKASRRPAGGFPLSKGSEVPGEVGLEKQASDDADSSSKPEQPIALSSSKSEPGLFQASACPEKRNLDNGLFAECAAVQRQKASGPGAVLLGTERHSTVPGRPKFRAAEMFKDMALGGAASDGDGLVTKGLGGGGDRGGKRDSFPRPLSGSKSAGFLATDVPRIGVSNVDLQAAGGIQRESFISSRSIARSRSPFQGPALENLGIVGNRVGPVAGLRVPSKSAWPLVDSPLPSPGQRRAPSLGRPRSQGNLQPLARGNYVV